MFLLAILARLPRRLSQFLGSICGWLHYRFNSRSAKVTGENLRLCFPDFSSDEINQLAVASLRETGKMVLETPAAWQLKSATLAGWIDQSHDETKLHQALASEQGLIILLPHIGNWELFNAYFSRFGVMTALYQPPDKPYLQTVIKTVRSRFGNLMVQTDIKGIAGLYRTLNRGGTVVILPDQVPAVGEFSPFFGQPALTDRLCHRLLRKTGAVVLAAVVLRNPAGRFDIHWLSPAREIYAESEAVSLAALNQLVEHCIALAPAQYQWEYKRFRRRPAGEKKLYRYNKPPSVHV